MSSVPDSAGPHLRELTRGRSYELLGVLRRRGSYYLGIYFLFRVPKP